MKYGISYFSLGLVVGFLFTFFLFAKRVNPFPPSQHADTTFVYDTTMHHIYDSIPFPVPVPYKVIDSVAYAYYDTLTIYDTIPVAQTPDEVVADYYRLRYYSDTITDDNLQFYIREQIGANRILNRSTSYVIKRPQTIITRKLNYLYIGGMLGKVNAPMLTYTNDRLYAGAGYDPFNKSLVVSGGIKLYSW